MVKLYLDTADIAMMQTYAPLVHGFTTNPSLMRKAGVKEYLQWGYEVCERFPNHAISFEVIADEFDKMGVQAERIANWGQNVFVKIPVTDTKGVSSGRLIKRLVRDGIKVG